MADSADSSIKVRREGVITGCGRFKIIRITKEGGANASATISPGKGFTHMIGGIGEASGSCSISTATGQPVFTLAFSAGTSGDIIDLMFFKI